MNERIKQLAEQAEEVEFFSPSTGCTLKKINLAKFAELIVQECIAVAGKERNPQNLNYKPSERFVESLKLHFGVK